MTNTRLTEIRAMLEAWEDGAKNGNPVSGVELILDSPGIVRELLVEIERLQSGFDWLSGQEVSISDFTAPCQCKNEYLQNEECSKGINPDDVCPYYNHRGTGECWVDYIKNIATAKEKS